MDHHDHLFTCISCSIAFHSPEEQRVHYRSDHHRYNMKRRVAGLSPISAAVFNQKIIQRRQETAVISSPKNLTCNVCNKTYSSENAYKTHINSKKHKDFKPTLQHSNPPPQSVSLQVDPDADQETILNTIDQKIAASRAKISNSHCLFCSHLSSSLNTNLSHMATFHSFFLPDLEYLTDLAGLVRYLAEKIAVGNVCLYCNGKGKEFRTIHAVQKHMVDKAHCKIVYDSQVDRLEISDYYDFTTSYPSNPEDEWEDVDDQTDNQQVTVIDEPHRHHHLSDTPLENTGYELVLPSGSHLLHKSLHKPYRRALYSQSKLPQAQAKSQTALIRDMLAQKNSALVPMKGAFGDFGVGSQVVKARNHGEAKDAGRHVKEFRDQKRREAFKTKVGFRHNHQKHFRDPLLQ